MSTNKEFSTAVSPAGTEAARIRQEWFGRLFPAGVPKLWCPPLTHYTADGAIDRARMAAHLRFLSPWVKGLLVPGSTGDAWELTAEETREVLEIATDEAGKLGLVVLAGALRPRSQDARAVINETAEFLKRKTGAASEAEALIRSRIRGFAVCPPKGRDLPSETLEKELSELLSAGLPLALYQLPQVTENEMSPELVSSLAGRFGNFLLFKDTSGRDAVAKSGRSLAGVLKVRGAEGGYAQWLSSAGGCYDGFLLSTANAFAAPLHQIIEHSAAGRLAEAAAISSNLAELVAELFRIVGGIRDGNAFANSAKAADHFYAHGPDALALPAPRLRAGSRLPLEVLRATREALARHGLLPDRGYLG
jgi:dihydrodipicolinate synthase/N-acetylneuraminate lyase